MVFAFSTANAVDTGKPGLTSPQTRAFNSSESEVARVSSAVSQNVETTKNETPRAVEAPAQSQKVAPRKSPLSPETEAEANRARDLSLTEGRPDKSVKALTEELTRQSAEKQQSKARAEEKTPAEFKAQQIKLETEETELREERRIKKAESVEKSSENSGPDPATLQAQRAYLDRVEAQRAYRKAAERENQVLGERARSTAAA